MQKHVDVHAVTRASEPPEEEKNRLLDHMKTLPAEALKHLTTQTATMAMDRLPNALHWPGTQIGP